MPFPLRGRQCFIQEIALRYDDPMADYQDDQDALVKKSSLERPQEEKEKIFGRLFKTSLSKNLREFGLSMVDERSAATIIIAVQVMVDRHFNIAAKGNIVADGTEFMVGAKVGKDFMHEYYPNPFDDYYPNTIEGAIKLASEKLSYRINETLVDYYLDKPEVAVALPENATGPDLGNRRAGGLAERSLAGGFSWSLTIKFLLFAALLGIALYQYVKPEFLQSLWQPAGKAADPAPVRKAPHGP